MKKILITIICIGVLFSCNNTKHSSHNKENIKPLKDTLWLEFTPENNDSLKVAVNYYFGIDTLASQEVMDRATIFYFTFREISIDELKKIIFLKYSEKRRNEVNENKISQIHIPVNKQYSFYVQLGTKKVHHLTGMVVDNFLIKIKDSIKSDTVVVRKVGTSIEQYFKF